MNYELERCDYVDATENDKREYKRNHEIEQIRVVLHNIEMKYRHIKNKMELPF